MKQEKTLITTHTGEPSQPVRIYYHVVKPKTVERIFEKLRCVYFEKPLQRWRWIYEHEAKKLRFERAYSKIPKEAKPVVIGEFFWRSNQELLLEVRSFERAIQALEFFEKRINPRVAIATKLRVVNRFFTAEEPQVAELLESPYDRFFDGDEVYIPDPLEFSKEVVQIQQSQNSIDQSSPPWLQYLENKFKEQLPEIEEIPLDVYRDKKLDSTRLQMALAFKTIEANQHFEGNESFSQYDLIQTITDSFVEMIQEEQMSQLPGNQEEE